MKASQPALPLIDREHPASLEVAGSELVTVLAKLKAQGAVVFGMASVGVSRWRLSIHWPQHDPAAIKKGTFNENGLGKAPCEPPVKTHVTPFLISAATPMNQQRQKYDLDNSQSGN